MKVKGMKRQGKGIAKEKCEYQAQDPRSIPGDRLLITNVFIGHMCIPSAVNSELAKKRWDSEPLQNDLQPPCPACWPDRVVQSALDIPMKLSPWNTHLGASASTIVVGMKRDEVEVSGPSR